MNSWKNPEIKTIPFLFLLATIILLAVFAWSAWNFFKEISSAAPFFRPAIKFLAAASAVAISFIMSMLYLASTLGRKARDVTNLATKELYFSREQFRILYENGPVPYLLLSLDGRIREPNLAALRLFGTKKNEFTDTHFTDWFPAEDRKEIEQLVEFLRGRLPIHNREVRVRKQDGMTRWALLSIFILNTGDEESHTGLAAFIDITERKEIERTKSEFVSLASHQLRTPLALMKWYAEALLGGDIGKLEEKQKDYLERIHKNNERMIELVTTLLNVSRLEMGTIVPRNEAADIAHIADDILQELSAHIEKKGIRIKRLYEENMPLVYTDSKFLRIVVENLLSNAVKYTPQNAFVRISLGEESGKVKIIVADTGYGIPPDEQEKIFTKMFRASNARQIDADGNGLGLYMVRSILELLGGSIGFESEFANGTTFTVTLPVGAPLAGRVAGE